MIANSLTTALALAAAVSPASAFFRMRCPGRLVRERLDPIVNPGGVSGHLHTISGGSGFSASMTYNQARASKCSSCEIKEDLSNYWTPQLYYAAKNGSFFPVSVAGDGEDTNGGMTVYYLQRGESNEKLHAFPAGFRMLAGDPMKRNYTGDLAADAIRFACLGAGQAETTSLPNYNCPGGLRAQVFFPSCWDGKNLDSADHRSHMSYPDSRNYDNGPCPASHPVHLVSIFYEILYDTPKFADQWYDGKQPFVFANGDPTGYGFHGDFVNGWDVDVLQKAVDTCTDGSGSVEKCGAVTRFTDDECNRCKLPRTVNEDVDGWSTRLPGCNPVSYGPERVVPPSTCDATNSLSPPIGDFTDLTSSKKWEYIGCGIDNQGGRTFSGKTTASDDMTVEKCVDFCSGAGFSYAGLEYGRECYCGNTLDPAKGPQEGIMGGCRMRCKGDAKEFCGAGSALSIYHKCGATCQNAPVVGGVKKAKRGHGRRHGERV